MTFDKWAADLADHIRNAGAPKDEGPVCSICDDDGWHWAYACHGGAPVEIKVHCIDCGGKSAGQPWDW